MRSHRGVSSHRGPTLEMLPLPPGAYCDGYVIVKATRRFTFVHDGYDVCILRPGRDPVSIGTHFLDPSAFALVRGSRWCASAGCGVVVYFLRPPFAPFVCDEVSAQWWEIGRDPYEPWDVVRLRVLDAHRLRIVVLADDGTTRAYTADVLKRRLRRHDLIGLPRPPV